jgi:hypothetical protein
MTSNNARLRAADQTARMRFMAMKDGADCVESIARSVFLTSLSNDSYALSRMLMLSAQPWHLSCELSAMARNAK